MEWCGDRKGRTSTSPPDRSPATECSRVTSRASCRVMAGRIDGSLRASMVFPAPGGPTIRRLWPPAAAISNARRAIPCPRTSERSTSLPDVGSFCRGGAGWMGGDHELRRNPATAASEGAGTTSSPSTRLASAALASGTTTPFSPPAAAAIAMGRTPAVATSSPFSDSSPANAYEPSNVAGTCAEAASTPRAMGRSKPGPSLRIPAGDRLTTTRRSGHVRPELSTAGRTRSRAS